MYIWIKLRWTEWYRVWPNIGFISCIPTVSNGLSCLAPLFHLQRWKHNFAATDGDRNGLRKYPDVFFTVTCTVLSPVSHEGWWTNRNKERKGSWFRLFRCGHCFTWMRGGHCKPNPEMWPSTSFHKNPNLDSFVIDTKTSVLNDTTRLLGKSASPAHCPLKSGRYRGIGRFLYSFLKDHFIFPTSKIFF